MSFDERFVAIAVFTNVYVVGILRVVPKDANESYVMVIVIVRCW